MIMFTIGKKIYEKYFLEIEFLFSILLITLVSIIIFFQYFQIWQNANFLTLLTNPVFPTIATISITLLGFIMTGVSVLISFTESGKMSLLKKSKHYQTLFDIFFSAIKYLAFTAFTSIIGIFSSGIFLQILFYLTLWGVIISSFRTYRCVWALEEIIVITKEVPE